MRLERLDVREQLPFVVDRSAREDLAVAHRRLERRRCSRARAARPVARRMPVHEHRRLAWPAPRHSASTDGMAGRRHHLGRASPALLMTTDRPLRRAPGVAIVLGLALTDGILKKSNSSRSCPGDWPEVRVEIAGDSRRRGHVEEFISERGSAGSPAIHPAHVQIRRAPITSRPRRGRPYRRAPSETMWQARDDRVRCVALSRDARRAPDHPRRRGPARRAAARDRTRSAGHRCSTRDRRVIVQMERQFGRVEYRFVAIGPCRTPSISRAGATPIRRPARSGLFGPGAARMGRSPERRWPQLTPSPAPARPSPIAS